ncbi:MAG: hypothetical protein EBZ36_07085, partial [Acidobacteria bacterium]|nr:hypothetical protein [Acidobacteriota bacterium]
SLKILPAAIVFSLLALPLFAQSLPEIPLRFSELKIPVHGNLEAAISLRLFGKNSGRFQLRPAAATNRLFRVYRIFFQDVPLHNAFLIARGKESRLTLYQLEREYILETLRTTGKNKSRAAEILGVDRRTLHRKLDEYRALDPDFEL